MAVKIFFCVGAGKAGTTTLYEALRSHPEICLSKIKEPNFFNDDVNYARGLDYYLKEYFPKVSEGQILGDFSPWYMVSERACARIREHYKAECKIIIVTREPVKRAFSHYQHRKRDGLESRNFLDAMLEYSSGDKLSLEYVEHGQYAKYGNMYVDAFGKENVMFLDSEKDLFSGVGLCRVFKFLNVSPVKSLSISRANPARNARYGTMGIRRLLLGESYIKNVVKGLLPPVLRQRIRLWADAVTLGKYAESEGVSSAVDDEVFDLVYKNEMAEFKILSGIDYERKKRG